MAASNDDWSCDANEAVRLSFVRPNVSQSGLDTVHEFHPSFTYPIFGKEERIFGYKGLDIEIRFATHNCHPQVLISYDKKFQSVGETRPMDCSAILKEFMPPPAFTENLEYNLINDKRASAWTPPGEKVCAYSRRGRNFEIWSGSLVDTNVRYLLDQIQIFVLFYIEGGQMLPLDDPDWSLKRWRVYFIYEKVQVPAESTMSPYILAGYGTTYRFYRFLPVGQRSKDPNFSSYPNIEPFDLSRESCRLRISQFVILPPYQSNGHGSEMYRTIYKEVMADKTISELTVEDPSEEFDKLRDANDWKVLEPAFRSAGVKINIDAVAKQARFEKMPKKKLLDLDSLERIRKQHKIADRQFYRLLELYLLAQIPYSHRAAGGASLTKLLIKKHKTGDPIDVRYYWLRNLIKQRIWWKNHDKLVDVPASEISEQIGDVARGQEDEYEGLLLAFAAKKAAEDGLNGGTVAGASSSSEIVSSRKRKIIEDDEDEDGAISDASKKARA